MTIAYRVYKYFRFLVKCRIVFSTKQRNIMNIIKIIETTLAAAAVIAVATFLPLTEMMAAELLITGALVAMVGLETKKRCF